MTCIAKGVLTKRQLKMILSDEDGDIQIEDPSIFAPFTGTLREYMDSHQDCTLTNHPKRSWFARVHWGRNKFGDRVLKVE